MHGIASLLDSTYYAKVEGLWDELEIDCSVIGIQITPLPHFSWQVSQDYDMDRLRPALQRIAAGARPFKIRTTGIGLFTGPKPVVFISLVKDSLLLRFHELIWKLAKDASIFPSPFYAPQAWMPHITLAYGETNWQRLSCVMEKLVYHPFNWEIEVDHIAVINQFEGQIGEKSLYMKFGSSGE
jgi:2'-5' RNA ligase